MSKVRRKVTITVDPDKLAEARGALGAPSASATIDAALSQLIRRHRVLHDARAYSETPPTNEEAARAAVSPDWRELADDTDWDAEWPENA